MSAYLPKSFLIVLCLLGIVFGGVLGIASAQNALATGIPLALGLFILPWTLVSAPQVDTVSHVPLWLLWLIQWYYPAVILLTGICSYWAQLHSGLKQRLWSPYGLLMSISIGVALLANLLAPSLNRNGTAFSSTIVFLSWLNLLLSAGLGWGVACFLPRPKPRKSESRA